MTQRRLKLVVHGAAGRIGRLLLAQLADDSRFDCVAALVRADSVCLGQPVLPGAALRFSQVWPEQVDVVIDFSLPQALPGLIAEVRQHGCALVSGTTGLSEEQGVALRQLSAQLPLLWASNFSLGAAVLAELSALARRWLPESAFEAAIFEAHHSAKRDAPSGTALTLAAAVASAAASGELPACSSLRAGAIVGEHTVYFAGPAERIELTHRATDRSLFARGALEAAAWLSGQAPGCYQMRDLLRMES